MTPLVAELALAAGTRDADQGRLLEEFLFRKMNHCSYGCRWYKDPLYCSLSFSVTTRCWPHNLQKAKKDYMKISFNWCGQTVRRCAWGCARALVCMALVAMRG